MLVIRSQAKTFFGVKKETMFAKSVMPFKPRKLGIFTFRANIIQLSNKKADPLTLVEWISTRIFRTQ